MTRPGLRRRAPRGGDRQWRPPDRHLQAPEFRDNHAGARLARLSLTRVPCLKHSWVPSCSRQPSPSPRSVVSPCTRKLARPLACPAPMRDFSSTLARAMRRATQCLESKSLSRASSSQSSASWDGARAEARRLRPLRARPRASSFPAPIGRSSAPCSAPARAKSPEQDTCADSVRHRERYAHSGALGPLARQEVRRKRVIGQPSPAAAGAPIAIRSALVALSW